MGRSTFLSLYFAVSNTSFEVQVALESWTYGRLLLRVAEQSGTIGAGEKQQSIAGDLRRAVPETRISVGDALAKLQEWVV